jgi:hypothetical protein
MIIAFLIISFIYNLFIWIKYKTIPTSLSETSYMLEDKRHLFTLYCIVSAFLILPCLLSTVPETLTMLPFFMCSGLMFSGASPLFKQGLDKRVHYTASIIAFIAFLVFLILEMGWISTIIFATVLAMMVLWKPKCYVYFAEMLSFIFIIFYLL